MNISRRVRLSGTVAAISGHRRIAGCRPAAACRAAGAAARPAPLRSPEIHPDRTVTFRLLAPKAREVTLNGSWDNGTNLKMTKDEAGVWSTTIGPLGAATLGLLVHRRRRQGARSEQRRDAARRRALRQPADDLRPGVGVVGLQGRAARHRAGRLVSVADAEAGEPPHDGVHAAGLRDRQSEVSRARTCCTAAAATRMRG